MIILKPFKDACMAIKVRKFAFFTNKIGYLSYNIRSGRLKVATHTELAIHELTT